MVDDDLAALARSLWAVGEPVHAVVYFSDATAATYAEAGLKGFWRGYFATRVAPLGPVPAEVVAATFFNFHPDMVRRAIPSVWDLVTPAGALDLRLAGADAGLRAAFGDDTLAEPEVAEAADVAEQAAAAIDLAGRPLGAANAALDRPEPVHLRLWHALTILREHRGDGHNAALVANGIDGVACHALSAAVGRTTRERTEPFRGWSAEDWDAAEEDLRDRGLVDADARATSAGEALREAIEAATDRAALAPIRALGPERTQRLIDLLTPLAARLFADDVLPAVSPIGLAPVVADG